MLIVLFNENEEQLFQKTVEWLASKMETSPVLIKKQITGFHIDPFTRTFVNEKGKLVYLTAK